jgi:aquaporin Z
MSSSRYAAEFFGTFVFLSVILQVTRAGSSTGPVTPLYIALGLLAAVLLVGPISGCHVNPAISVMSAVNKSLPMSDLLPFVAAQLLGGLAANSVFDMVMKK